MLDREKREPRRPRRRPDQALIRRKPCYFCEHRVTYVDYKDATIRNFISDKGKIVPSKISGVCHGHQRDLSRAIKRARMMALLPYAAR